MLLLLSLQQGMPDTTRAPANELKTFDTPDTGDGMCPGHPNIKRTSPHCQKKLDARHSQEDSLVEFVVVASSPRSASTSVAE